MNSILNPTEPVEPDEGTEVAPAVIVGSVTAVAFGVGGFFLTKDSTGAMGTALFLLVPCAAGFACALLTRGRKIVIASLVIAAITCTLILLLTGMEGWVCVLMSAPFLAVGLTIGALLGVLARRLIGRRRRRHQLTFFLVAIIPLFLMGANNAEKPSRRMPRVETFVNTLVVDGSRDVVWNQLKSFDRIKGSKGLLMTIGLPVPVSCTMSGEGVGATRTCYFESGHIEERVTEWNPPTSMKLEITAFDVPGRPWLSFKDASYDLSEENGRTVITRKTTIVSRLSPAWYWRRMEQIGVETEHEYLFEEVKRKVEAKK